MHKPDYDFVLDLPKGQESERTIAFLLYMQDGDFIEVKRDYIVSDTGNIAIEYKYDGKKSGIAKTKAVWWAIHLNGSKYNGECIVIIKTDRLRSIARKYIGKPKKDVSGGDNNKARIILLPVKELLNAEAYSTQ